MESPNEIDPNISKKMTGVEYEIGRWTDDFKEKEMELDYFEKNENEGSKDVLPFQEMPKRESPEKNGDEKKGGEDQKCQTKTTVQRKMNSWQVMGEIFQIDARYQVLDYLGAGAYGIVVAAKDKISNETFAIKKCKNIFQSRTLAKRTLREIRLLRLVHSRGQVHNIIRVVNIIVPKNLDHFTDIHVCFELMETDLAQVIRSPQVLREQHVLCFAYQILKGLEFLHGCNIVHRDLKPRNLLVNGDCHLKIADFGLARVYDSKNSSKIVMMTEYVTTRWYRAPEILFGWSNYTSAVDMWALGCILAELIIRVPLFPGSCSKTQVEMIIKCLGKPNETFIERCRKSSIRKILREMPPYASRVVTIASDASPAIKELLGRLLTLDPLDRIKADEILLGPFGDLFAPFAKAGFPFNAAAPPCASDIIKNNPHELAFEDTKISCDELRKEVLKEVSQYNDIDIFKERDDEKEMGMKADRGSCSGGRNIHGNETREAFRKRENREESKLASAQPSAQPTPKITQPSSLPSGRFTNPVPSDSSLKPPNDVCCHESLAPSAQPSVNPSSISAITSSGTSSIRNPRNCLEDDLPSAHHRSCTIL